MKTLLLILLLSAPEVIHASGPSASGILTTANMAQIQAPALAFDLPRTVENFGKTEPAQEKAAPAPASVPSTPDLTQAESMSGSNAEILVAPLAAPEPSSMAFSVCVIALIGVLFLRMRAHKNSIPDPLDT
jgi:hypothetical protein